MIEVIFILPLAIGILTLWIAYTQYSRENRIILGWILYLVGGATISYILLLVLSTLNHCAGEYDMGQYGGYIIVIGLFVGYGSALSLILLLIAPIWIWISKTITKPNKALQPTPIGVSELER